MDAARQHDSGAELAAAVAAAIGGFEPRDAELVLDPAPAIARAGGAPRTADLAGLDGDGRAVLVVRATGAEAVLAAIDALAWCDARGDLLVRRVGADPRLPPAVVLVLVAPDAAALAGLATLRAEDLRVLEARTVRTARGVEEDLGELDLAGGGEIAPASGSPWDARLDAGARDLVERVRLGLGRIDPEAEAAPSARSIVWRSGSATLVALRAPRGRLEAEVGGERFELGAEGDVARVLEGALRRLYLDDDDQGSGEERERTSPPRPAKSLMPTGPLLSQDELAALRGEL